MKIFRNKTRIVLLIILFASTLSASDGDHIGYTTYYFSDSGNNSVVTTSFNLAKKILARTAFLLDIELDKVTVPPIDGTTGASRPSRRKNESFEKNRGQIILGVEQGLSGNTSVALNVYRSQEVDYVSNSAIITISQDLFQKNTTVTLRGQINKDKVGQILDDGSVYNKDKKTVTGTFSISQILSKTTVFEVGYDYQKMDGLLSDPYRQVQIFDANNVYQLIQEMHPVSRLRQAVSTRLSQYIDAVDASIIGSYRYYFDDWNIRSHTMDIRFNKYVFKDFIVGFNYRYYTQTAAKFYKDRYTFAQNNAYMTADYKMKPFGSNNFGFTLRYLLRGLIGKEPGWEFLEKSSFEVMYFRYTNDLDFSANIVQGSLNLSL